MLLVAFCSCQDKRAEKILADSAVLLNLLKDTTLYGLGTHYHIHFLLRDDNIKPVFSP
jgi:hypothetical protein